MPQPKSLILGLALSPCGFHLYPMLYIQKLSYYKDIITLPDTLLLHNCDFMHFHNFRCSPEKIIILVTTPVCLLKRF